MTDEIFMREALRIAKNAEGRTSPNPLVGAVVVREGKIIAEGWHRQAGTPHAEVHALNMAGELAQGATLYVTLEPCSHFGRTPRRCSPGFRQNGRENHLLIVQNDVVGEEIGVRQFNITVTERHTVRDV